MSHYDFPFFFNTQLYSEMCNRLQTTLHSRYRQQKMLWQGIQIHGQEWTRGSPPSEAQEQFGFCQISYLYPFTSLPLAPGISPAPSLPSPSIFLPSWAISFPASTTPANLLDRILDPARYLLAHTLLKTLYWIKNESKLCPAGKQHS